MAEVTFRPESYLGSLSAKSIEEQVVNDLIRTGKPEGLVCAQAELKFKSSNKEATALANRNTRSHSMPVRRSLLVRRIR